MPADEATPTDKTIVEAIVAMAHKLSMKVIADGVETVEQRDLLAVFGCDFAQGYFFGKPMPANEFLNYLKSAQLSEGGESV